MPPSAPQFDAEDVVWIWDPSRARIVWASAAAARFWGEPSVADLINRPFLADDPNARAMNALLRSSAPSLDQAGEDADGDDREAELTLFPDGAPVLALCRGRVRRLQGAPGRVWIAIHAAPATAADPALAREGALLAVADTAFALIDETGAPRFLNPAARRLLTDADSASPGSVFARFQDPERGRRAARTALSRGAFSHGVEFAPQSAEERPVSARVLYRRIQDPETGDALIALEATTRASERSSEARALRAAAAGADGGRFGVVLLDATTLTVQEASAAAVAMIGAEKTRRGAVLADLFPEKTEALSDAVEAVRRGGGAQNLDVPIVSALSRGPWGTARLSLALGDGSPTMILALADLGPERRALLLRDQERRAEESALARLGIGMAFLGPEGRVHRLSPPAAAALGVDPDAVGAAVEAGLLLPDLLSAPGAEEFRRRLDAAFGSEPDGSNQEQDAAGGPAEPPIDTAIAGLDGAARLVRLSLSQPFAFGRNLVCVALDVTERGAGPQELRDLAAAGGSQPDARRATLVDPRLAQTASHAFRTALTTIKGFAELARDDPQGTGSPRLRQRLDDIVDTASALTALVDRSFQAPPETDGAAAGAPEAVTTVDSWDLASIPEAAAGRAAARHPVWASPSAVSLPVTGLRADLDEALDILIAEAADRGPTRVSADRSRRADGGPAGLVQIEAPASADRPWPPLALRAAALLIERAGGALNPPPAQTARDGIVRLEIVFALADR